MRTASAAIACFCLTTLCHPILATFEDDTRYTKLKNELGAATPTGAGVRMAHVEGHAGAIDPNTNLPPDGKFDYIADPAEAQFLDPEKNFNVIVPFGTSGADTSTHATFTVGWWLYGNTFSVASGVIDIDALLANHWFQDGLLRYGQPLAPRVAPPGNETLPHARQANHSWIFDLPSPIDMEVLSRLDWRIQQDNVIQVVGVGNSRGSPPMPLLSGTFNAITAGGISGDHAIGTAATTEPLYPSGRTRPDIVSPVYSSTSHNTARVSSAVSLLIETGRDGGLTMSNGSVTSRKANQTGPPNIQTIYHAETVEVIRAALMAGANRQAVTNDDNNGFNDVYVVNTTNGLNDRYGAGQLDIYNSYHILAGGEHDSREEGDLTDITSRGFDYDTSFTDSDAATYHFTIDAESDFTASLVWDIDIDINKVVWDCSMGCQSNPNLASAATLHDLDLFLYDRLNDSLVTSSTSLIENTEHLFVTDLAPGDYRLEIAPQAGQTFDWHYGVAWQALVPEPSSPWLLGCGLLWLRGRRCVQGVRCAHSP